MRCPGTSLLARQPADPGPHEPTTYAKLVGWILKRVNSHRSALDLFASRIHLAPRINVIGTAVLIINQQVISSESITSLNHGPSQTSQITVRSLELGARDLGPSLSSLRSPE